MELEPHPRFQAFLASMGRLGDAALPWQGIVFRSVAPRHAEGPQLCTGRASRVFGGRWNPPGPFAAVYTSLDPETAMSEALARVRSEGFPDHCAMPRLFVAIQVSLERSIDLSAAGVLRELSTSRREVEDCDWRREQEAGREALTQAIGRAVFRTGLDGMFVPSAGNRGGINLVVLPDNMRAGGWIGRLGSEDWN